MFMNKYHEDDRDLPGSILRILRESAGISLKDAARAFDLGVVELSDIERGRVPFPVAWSFAHVILCLHHAGDAEAR